MRVWAIPWLSDVRVVFYWRDMLEEAGIDEETAFSSAEQVEQTMSRLQASGIAAPWGIWATRVNVTLHNAASWVWGAGGSIMSDTKKEILFDQPEAMEGILAYLRLHRYMPPGLDQLLPDSEVIDLFTARRVAVAMGPALWFERAKSAFEQEPETPDKIGIAVPPGPAFVGGSHLIVWQHTQHVLEAIPLIRFLTSKEAQAEYCHATGFLPVRPDVLAKPPYTEDARYQVITEALGTGRTFPVVPRWGAIEERLGKSLVWLWNSLLADPDQDLEDFAKPYIESTARRLVVTLGMRR
jgi:multiple sugar transport system substrate-binding protein